MANGRQSTILDQPLPGFLAAGRGGLTEEPLTARQAFSDLCRKAGSRLAPCTLGNWKPWGTPEEQERQKQVLDAAKEFAAQIGLHIADGRNLVLIGSVGTGKDHLTMGLLRFALQAGCTSLDWTTGVRFFGSYRDGITRQTPEEETTNGWCRAKILVISELLAANETLPDWQLSQLWSVLDQRYRNRMPTWLSINVETRKDAVAKIGEKILSRLEDPGLVLRFFWSDHRKRAK